MTNLKTEATSFLSHILGSKPSDRRGRRTFGATVALAALGALLAGTTSAMAQPYPNMLANPDFEYGGPNVQGAYGFYTEYSWWMAAQRGNFSVRTNPAPWNPGLFPSCADHTPGSGVNMMCVDGDTHRVVWAEGLSGLPPSTYYRFSFWYISLWHDNPAILRIQFRPEPNWGASTWPAWVYLPGNTNCVWQQATAYWCSTNTITGENYPNMTIVLDNVQSGSTGADFAIDDMEFVKVDCVGPPVITANPSSLAATPGGTANFAITAQLNTSKPVTYQWRRGGVPLVDGPAFGGAVISGAHTASLTLTNVSRWNEGSYDCKVTNPCGDATSNKALLSVNHNPQLGWVSQLFNLGSLMHVVPAPTVR